MCVPILWIFSKNGGTVTTDGDFSIYKNNRYRGGFLYKTMAISALITDGVKPTLSELEKFEESMDDADLECIKFSLNSLFLFACIFCFFKVLIE